MNNTKHLYKREASRDLGISGSLQTTGTSIDKEV